VAEVGRLAREEPGVLTDADRLRAKVRGAGRPTLASATLSADGVEAYRRLLEETCRRIALRARAVAEVRHAVQAEIASQVSRIKEDVDVLVRQSDRRDRFHADTFERNYLSYVADDHATFELFQVSVGRAPARQRFADFYSVPSITRRQRSAADTDLTGAGTDGSRTPRRAPRWNSATTIRGRTPSRSSCRCASSPIAACLSPKTWSGSPRRRWPGRNRTAG
jgi:hypothetical protein